jgi:hypothetical protein
LDRHDRFANVGDPSLETLDCEVTQEAVTRVRSGKVHVKDGEGGLDEFDELEDGEAEEIGRADRVLDAVHANKPVLGRLAVIS